MKNNHPHNYTCTREILLGKKSIRHEFKPFVAWFEKTYDAEIANILFEIAPFPNYPIKTPIPSLKVTFKYLKGFNKFNDESVLGSESEIKQVIFKKFKDTLLEQGVNQEDLVNKPYNISERARNLEEYVSVDFLCFEYIEKGYVRRSVSKAKMDELLTRINNKDIWKISNNYSGTTFFLYTEIQVKKYRDTEVHEKWKDLFFDLIQEYNQLVFFKRESLFISLDSKERLDNANDSELSQYK